MGLYKGYSIVNPPNVGTMYKIQQEGSGAVPAILRGMYTSPVEAQRDIDKYLSSFEDEKNRRAAKAAATRAAKQALRDKADSDG